MCCWPCGLPLRCGPVTTVRTGSAPISEVASGDEEHPGTERCAVSRCFGLYRLPLRLQVTLWHLAVEQDVAGTVTRLLGAETDTVASWTVAVEERFRTAFIEVISEPTTAACRPFTRLLVNAAEAPHRHAAAASAVTGSLDAHLAACSACSRALRDLPHLRDQSCGVLLAESCCAGAASGTLPHARGPVGRWHRSRRHRDPPCSVPGSAPPATVGETRQATASHHARRLRRRIDDRGCMAGRIEDWPTDEPRIRPAREGRHDGSCIQRPQRVPLTSVSWEGSTGRTGHRLKRPDCAGTSIRRRI